MKNTFQNHVNNQGSRNWYGKLRVEGITMIPDWGVADGPHCYVEFLANSHGLCAAVSWPLPLFSLCFHLISIFL